MEGMQARTRDLDRSDHAARRLDFTEIPLIDMADLHSEDREARPRVAGGIGAEVAVPAGAETIAFLFGEDQARYLVASADAAKILQAAETAGIPALEIGRTGGTALTVGGHGHISLDSLRAVHEGWLPRYAAGPAGH